ncbi:N-acetylglucosamine kinase [Lysinibacter cavernae]|uniref:N-acetylglucosamine kinase-like BadF-type ATPase n=1 Tax=Lysinibacter cavernae TaxID=1640652 RepID=A0A7X5QYZ0_9MICO|nr:BadF/BadG/BcrA/BcrD ATPase family protein [Lysinibacter cavernae]NIH52367.1 N-acetylglucosamine kinase-like BadF-type ATPase [Lysinibacter cavernae]
MGVTVPSPSVLPVVLGVDAGGTKTDVAICDLKGNVLANTRGRSRLPQYVGPAEAVANLLGYLEPLVAALNARFDHGVQMTHATLSMSGADLPEEIDAITTEARRQLAPAGLISDDLVVENDMFALLRAGTSAADALVVGCGTGMNCVGHRANGSTARFSSLGYLSGDWGGGSDLSRAAFWHACRGEDGRGQFTELSAAIAQFAGTATAVEAAHRLHLGQLGQDLYDGFAPTIFEIAERSGDPVATRLVRSQADEIIAYVRAAMQQLGWPADRPSLAEGPTEILLGGSVIVARHPLLIDQVIPAIEQLAPSAAITFVTAKPVLGSVLSSLDRAHGGTTPDQIEQQVREDLNSVNHH